MICHINSMDFWVDRIWLDAFLDHSELCNIFHMIYKIYHCAVVCVFLIQFHAGKIFHTYHMNEPCHPDPGSLVNVRTLGAKSLPIQEVNGAFFESYTTS